MSNDEKQAALDAAKSSLGEAREELRSFRAKHGIKKGETPSEPKVAEKLEKLEKRVSKREAAMHEAKAALKGKTPKAERVSKYNYPKDCDTPEKKKKFRQEARKAAKAEMRAAKKAEKTPKTRKAATKED
jgi:hypothetical protein